MKYTIIVTLGLLLTLYTSAQSLQNGNFEGGYQGWAAYSKAGDAIVGSFPSETIQPTVYPRSGNYMMRLGGFGYNENSMSQIVTLPVANLVKLEIYYQTRSATTSECGGLWVGSKINVLVSGTSIMETYLCNYNDVLQWTYGYFDLSAVAGQQVEIKFAAEAANSVWSYIYIDDISIWPTGTGSDAFLQPRANILEQNFPNPFSSRTSIHYVIGKPARCCLKIFDHTGREMTTLFDEYKEAGDYTLYVDRLSLPPGTYCYRLVSDEFTDTKKMIVVE